MSIDLDIGAIIITVITGIFVITQYCFNIYIYRYTSKSLLNYSDKKISGSMAMVSFIIGIFIGYTMFILIIDLFIPLKINMFLHGFLHILLIMYIIGIFKLMKIMQLKIEKQKDLLIKKNKIYYENEKKALKYIAWSTKFLILNGIIFGIIFANLSNLNTGIVVECGGIVGSNKDSKCEMYFQVDRIKTDEYEKKDSKENTYINIISNIFLIIFIIMCYFLCIIISGYMYSYGALINLQLYKFITEKDYIIGYFIAEDDVYYNIRPYNKKAILIKKELINLVETIYIEEISQEELVKSDNIIERIKSIAQK